MAEARKYLRDAQLRQSALSHEFISPTPPIVSAFTGLILVVDPPHNADAAHDWLVQSEANVVIMRKFNVQKTRYAVRLSEPELALLRRGDNLDPRLIELVRALARRAAREWRDHIAQERHQRRS